MDLRLTTRLFFCAALFAGCDEGVDPGPDQEFRETTSCLQTGTLTTTVIVAKGIPDPDDPHGDRAIAFVPELVDEFVIGYARMSPENEKVCTAVCEKEDLGWTGENCVAGRGYKTGEYSEYETEKGERRWSVPR